MGSLALAFAIWQFLSSVLFNPFLIPPPLEVIRTAIPMLTSGEILGDVTISISRVLVGFVTGSLAGVVIGVLLGQIRLMHDLLDPILELLRYLSPTAMIPDCGHLVRDRRIFKILPNLLGHIFHRRHQHDGRRMARTIARQRAAQCLGANQLQIFVLVIVPSAVPYIVTGMRVAMASSFMSIIPAEILAANSGIGYLLQKSSMLLRNNRYSWHCSRIHTGLWRQSDFPFFFDRVLARYMSFVSQT